jgi:hypothetical protein
VRCFGSASGEALHFARRVAQPPFEATEHNLNVSSSATHRNRRNRKLPAAIQPNQEHREGSVGRAQFVHESRHGANQRRRQDWPPSRGAQLDPADPARPGRISDNVAAVATSIGTKSRCDEMEEQSEDLVRREVASRALTKDCGCLRDGNDALACDELEG